MKHEHVKIVKWKLGRWQYLIAIHFQSLWVGSAQLLEHGGGATRAGVVADVPPGGGAKCATHEAGTLLHTIGCHRYVDIT